MQGLCRRRVLIQPKAEHAVAAIRKCAAIGIPMGERSHDRFGVSAIKPFMRGSNFDLPDFVPDTIVRQCFNDIQRIKILLASYPLEMPDGRKSMGRREVAVPTRQTNSRRTQRILDIQKIIHAALSHPWIIGLFFVVTLMVNLMALRRIRKEETRSHPKPDPKPGKQES